MDQAQERRFPFDLHTSPEQEPAEVHILLYHGKDAFGLDAPVHTQKLPLSGVDPLLHRFPLGGESFGCIDDLASLLQRFLAARVDTLLFQGTVCTVFAAIDRGGRHKTGFGFGQLIVIVGKLLARCTGVAVRISTSSGICHVTPVDATNAGSSALIL